METSVLKANEESAIRCWIDFKALNEKEDWKSHGVEFRKKDLTEDKDGAPLKKGSFEIHYTQLFYGVRKGKAVFRFLKKNCGNEVQWDEKFVTI